MVVDNTYQQTKVSEVFSRRLTDKLSIVQFGVARASFENVEIFVAAKQFFLKVLGDVYMYVPFSNFPNRTHTNPTKGI